MKKMVIFIGLMMALATAAFAYEPNKDCVTVKGNKQTYYYQYIYGFKNVSTFTYNVKSGKVVIEKTGTLSGMWATVKKCREMYALHLQMAASRPEHSNSLQNFLNEWKDEYENGLLNEDEMKKYESIIKLAESQAALAGTSFPDDGSSASHNRLVAKEYKYKVLNKFPFFTEENWLTLTEEEWNKMLQDFCREENNK